MSIFCVVDDKHVPLYRIMWVSALPHYCGNEDCQREGQYEIRLEHGEAVWASTPEERDAVLAALEAWAEGEPEGGLGFRE
ncbi:MAG TPA: hypothetical protein EYP56_21200 [Planctomycetaceae bacterium]|nr:hypothetical protein [Planctomycetaceae bacterium]HIQ21015.1 hypothetical protein [Planctomycetota bacterium]